MNEPFEPLDEAMRNAGFDVKPSSSPLNDEEFNAMLSGPLHHPLPMFTSTRLALALRAVVDATGEPGVKALREHCQQREADDKYNSGQARGLLE